MAKVARLVYLQTTLDSPSFPVALPFSLMWEAASVSQNSFLPSLSATSCVTLGEILSLSEPLFLLL